MRVTHHKYGSQYKRKLHLKDGIWTWRYAGGKICIRSPDRKISIHTDPYEVSGISEKMWMAKILEGQREQPSIDVSAYPPFGPKHLVMLVEKYKGQ